MAGSKQLLWFSDERVTLGEGVQHRLGAHPLRGLLCKKVDGISGSAVSGTEFELTDAEGQVVATATSGEDGMFSFRELTEGRYTLTETKVPGRIYG